jgi:hypothetical protein
MDPAPLGLKSLSGHQGFIVTLTWIRLFWVDYLAVHESRKVLCTGMDNQGYRFEVRDGTK